MERFEKGIQSLVANLIKWTPSGVGVAMTGVSLWHHDWTQGVLTAFLTASSSVWVSFSGKFIEEVEKEAATRGGSLGKWVFVVGDRFADLLVNKWKALTSGFEQKYFKRLEYICRNYETQGLDKDRVLKLKRVFVPLKIAQKSFSQISPNLIQSLREKGNPSGQRDIGEILVLMNSDPTRRHFAILGAPGSGKTTLLRYLTLAYVTRTQRDLHPKAPRWIPVLLYLRDIYKTLVQTPKITLPKLITQWVERLEISDPLSPPPDWFANKLGQNKCLVMLDGLDEVADQQERQQVSRWVDAQMARYPELPILLTSRPFGYETAQLRATVTVLEVQPFSLGQMQQFIHNWYLATEILSQQLDDPGVQDEARTHAEDLIRQVKNSAPLAAMAVNPLLLTMIATVHHKGSALPGKRVELYEKICQVLLEKRLRAKQGPDLLKEFSADQKQSVLQVLALNLMENRTRSFTLEQIKPWIQNKLTTTFADQVTPEQFIQQIKDVSGLLIMKEQEGVYEFAHLSFQEYLASVEIKETNQEDRLLKVFEDPEQISWWAEAIRLYGAKSDVSNLIDAALSEPVTTEKLVLAYDCLKEKKEVKPEIEERLLQRVEKDLESQNPESFELAARVKLFRRLKQLLRIDDDHAIDQDMITAAEYQVFLYEKELMSKEEASPVRNINFEVLEKGKDWRPNAIMNNILFDDAIEFCAWLSLNDPLSQPLENLTIYRLPTEIEIKDNLKIENSGENSCWINRDSDPNSGIRVVKAKLPIEYKEVFSDLPLRYMPLFFFLVSGQWQAADLETSRIMLQIAGGEERGYLDENDIAKFPIEDLKLIDHLWFQASEGRFGFSVQKQIFIDVGGKPGQRYDEQIWQKFCDRVGWKVNRKWLNYSDLTFSSSAPEGHLPAYIFPEISSLASRL